jgi:intracellular sulfur oxidation DsrE/DsrF family protein
MLKFKYAIVGVIILAIATFSFSWKTSVNEGKNEHRIVIQLTSGDTMVHKQLMKQLSNITSVSSTTKIEVVCHGAGLDMITEGKTIVKEKVQAHAAKGIQFNACEFSLKERKVERSLILEGMGFVPAGIIEIVKRQEEGWSYIKAG